MMIHELIDGLTVTDWLICIFGFICIVSGTLMLVQMKGESDDD